MGQSRGPSAFNRRPNVLAIKSDVPSPNFFHGGEKCKKMARIVTVSGGRNFPTVPCTTARETEKKGGVFFLVTRTRGALATNQREERKSLRRGEKMQQRPC